MKQINSLIKKAIVLLFLIFLSCGKANQKVKKEIITKDGVHFGDSIFLNDQLLQIAILDTSFYIDSIVFERDNSYENGLKAIRTYMKGRRVFENIDYYKNGIPKEYLFIDEKNERYFYRRQYNEKGALIKEEGELFFQGFIDKINPETLEVKDDGSRMGIKIFYPNPPDCASFLFVKLDTIEGDVFKQNPYIPFLKEVWVDTEIDKKPWHEIDIHLRLTCNRDTVEYNKPLYFKVNK